MPIFILFSLRLRPRLLPALFVFCALLMALFAPLARAADPLAAEKAFAMRARAFGPGMVEVIFDVAPAYYLYGGNFRFAAKPPEVVLGAVQRPPGEQKDDPFLGEVETYREQLRMLLPIEVPAGIEHFTLLVTSQGCWDGGVCYPPTTQSVEITPAAADSGNSADPGNEEKSSGAASASGDESGRLADLLASGRHLLMLVSFFGFGLLLAFSPCMLPMTPVLLGIIVGAGARVSRRRALALALAYVFGMSFTYALAGVAAGLTGSMLAAALQNVWVLSAFALLFVLLALSMFGFYTLQLPSALQNRLSNTARREKGGHIGGVAIMGALSGLILGPCVTPFLTGALLYIARTGDAVFGGMALFVLALGMGTPLIALALATHSLLPKAGAWMENVNKAAGVLLLAAALWIVSPVLAALALMLGWATLLLFSGVFLSALDPLPVEAGGWRRFWKGVGVTLLLGGAAMLLGALAGARAPLQPLAVFHARVNANAPIRPAFVDIASVVELDARLAATDRPVLLDFYADWCVTCKEMERDTFSDPAVAARMERMLLLRVDVTDYTAAHKALLQRFNLVGPPGVVFFDASGRPLDGLRVTGFMAAPAFAALLNRAL